EPGTRTAMTAGMWLRVCSRPPFYEKYIALCVTQATFPGLPEAGAMMLAKFNQPELAWNPFETINAITRPLGDGHGRHGVRLDRRQHLLAKAFQVPHKHVVRHGPLIEVQHQRASAQGLGQLDQRITYLFRRAPRQPFAALQICQGRLAESLEAAQKPLPMLGPNIVVGCFAPVASL